MIRIQETIDEWLKVQAQWLYLDPIFSSEDIMQQMPEEGQMFQVVDNNWREIMKTTVQQPLVRDLMRITQMRYDIVMLIVNSQLYCASYNTCNDRWYIT